MKTYKKEGIADAIDNLTYALIVCSLIYFIPFLQGRDLLFYFLLITQPIEMKDFIFKGASIGKKIMGIRIYNENWKSPSYSILYRRSCYIGGLRFVKNRPQGRRWYGLADDVTILDIINIEREKFGTRLVDNKVFKRISAEAKLKEGRWEDNMSKMYDEYIMCVYSK